MSKIKIPSCYYIDKGFDISKINNYVSTVVFDKNNNFLGFICGANDPQADLKRLDFNFQDSWILSSGLDPRFTTFQFYSREYLKTTWWINYISIFERTYSHYNPF